MDSDVRDFVFKEHIFQIPDLTEQIERLEKKVVSLSGFLRRGSLKSRLEKLKYQQKIAYGGYENLKYFFEMTSNNSGNKLSYLPWIQEVKIEGRGMEVFKCNGKPTFYNSKKGEETLIPVKIGKEEAMLRIHRHPQIEISAFEDFEVDFSFRTHFSLGDKFYHDFTKKLEKTNRFFPSKFKTDGTFFGEPGEVYYRFCDGLYEELKKSVFIDCFHSERGRFPNDDFNDGRKNLSL